MEILAIGGSAGSLAVVMRIIACLDPAWDLCVVVVFHRKDSDDGALVDILARRTELEVKEIEDKEPIRSGVVYIAPANYHVLLETDLTFALDYSEKVNYSRPSIDVTFESAAQVFGSAASAMLLSGANADGVEGLDAIKQLGGRVIVQDPATAETPFMPRAAVNAVAVDHILYADSEETLLRQCFSNRA